MDRIGDSKVPRMDIAFYACKGAPATIQPGAVVKMAEALEWVLIDMSEGGEISDNRRAEIRNALESYYGESQ